MPWDMLRSQAAVDALLMILLLVWLGASAVMTLLAGYAARRHAEQEQGQRRRQRRQSPASAAADADALPSAPRQARSRRA
jgi:hypothetical protein